MKNLLTYADLLQLEWVLADRISEWEWRDKGLDDLIEKGRATLGRVREMIRLDEEGDKPARERVLASRKEEAERTARKLGGTLIRVTLHVSDQEEESLSYYAGTTPTRLLECFVADLTGSGRSVWPQCQLEARSWLEAHRYGEKVVEQLLKEKSEMAGEGGES